MAKAVRDPRWVDAVLGSQAVFFCGGAQERIVDTLWPAGLASPLLEAVWQVFRRGGVVAGTSAGAAIMSATMFRDAPSVMRVLKGELREGREFGPGLGFVGPVLFVDQHFLKRGRVGRLLPLMVHKGYTLGLGVEENTAAIVQGDTVEVVGARGALLVDLRDAYRMEARGGERLAESVAGRAAARLGAPAIADEAKRGAQSDAERAQQTAAGAPAAAFSLRGARLSLLDSGDRYDLAARRFLPSPAKLAEPVLDANSANFKPYFDDRPFHLDILGDNTLAQAMSHLIDNTALETRGLAFDAAPGRDDPAPQLGFEFRLYKDADSRGWSTGVNGSEEVSVAHLRLDVAPVRVAQPLYRPWSP
jgi:cyanophycinase